MTSKFGSTTALPRHVAIIMDGNGRWAKNYGKLRICGYKAGVQSVRRSVNFAINNEIEILTLYAFSSENWSRPLNEVLSLMELFLLSLNDEIDNLCKYNIKFRIIGDISRFNDNLQNQILAVERSTQQNDGLYLNIAASYSGKWDIINSTKQIAKQVQDGYIKPDQINESILEQNLCTHDLPPVDLLIRTGGEYRISNFLLWQIAYSEFYFTDILWPDFNEYEFKNALSSFAQRNRRYGNTLFK